ncbi:MAG: hypothetical protein CM1200mP14_18470 [Gammaproteobacteria bacterium]|nr:MAG: hypothetical protein CM1200mP14_18470 [Gammaproteobacteria bacterium]
MVTAGDMGTTVGLVTAAEPPFGSDLGEGSHTWAEITAGKPIPHVRSTTSGEGYCWGRNSYGQVGDGATSNRLIPTLISGEHVWEAISTGGYHACGLTVGGGAYCWGRDN